ncbi:MAG: restriction endonuclease subunit S [Chromatiaceae bacterium]|nr:restriction endonuclease subunit S [Chromatiaceae bacterium]
MNIPQRWQELALNRIVRMRSGDFISNDDIEPEGAHSVYGGNGFRGFTNQFNTIGPIVLVGRQGAHCGNVHFVEGEVWVSEHALRCLPEKEMDARWLAYALQDMHLNQYSVSAAQPGLSVDNLKHLRTAFPPLETQHRIARFLDEKTARIDGLIEKKRALLERLAEKRQALITRSVTKGLNPDAPMKPSGIDWLGDIPAHWDVKRFRFTARLISGSTPTTTVPEYWDGEIPWISPKDVKADELFSSADRVTEYAVLDYGLNLHADDNAVIVIRGMILARKVPVAVARGKYTINQDMKVIRSKGDVIPEFFQMYLSSIESFLFTLVAEAGHGTKALRTDLLSDVPILLPPIEEQRLLSSTLARNREKTDEVIKKIRDSLERLAEYRSALITAAVTGQIAELR